MLSVGVQHGFVKKRSALDRIERMLSRSAGHSAFALELLQLSIQASPHALQLAMNRFVIQLIKATPGQQHDVCRGKLVLAKPNGLSCDAFEAVPVNGAPNVLLAEDKTEARVAQGVR
jgi:hypothetical protein